MNLNYTPTIIFDIKPNDLKGLLEWNNEEKQLRLVCNYCGKGFSVFSQLVDNDFIINSKKVINLLGIENAEMLNSKVQMLLRSGLFDFEKLFVEEERRKARNNR